MQGRKSIFIPKQASTRKIKNIETAGGNLGGANSEEEDLNISKEISGSRRGGDRYNLLRYNRQRKQKLREFSFVDDTDADEELDEDKQVMMANKLKLNCFGNLEISLFWEEKLIILIRIAQLYTALLFFYYEQWPSNTRKYLTVMFSGFTGSLYIQD